MGMSLAMVVLATVGTQSPAPNASPADVAQAFYRLANQGKCREAEKLFTAESVAVIRRTLKPEDGFASFCASKGGKSPLTALAVAREEMDGDRAIVAIIRTHGSDMAMETDELVRQGGIWRIVVGESQNPAPPKQ